MGFTFIKKDGGVGRDGVMNRATFLISLLAMKRQGVRGRLNINGRDVGMFKDFDWDTELEYPLSFRVVGSIPSIAVLDTSVALGLLPRHYLPLIHTASSMRARASYFPTGTRDSVA